MAEYHTCSDVTNLLDGRTLRFAGVPTVSKNRALVLAFVDVDTEELLAVYAIDGALEAELISNPLNGTGSG